MALYIYGYNGELYRMLMAGTLEILRKMKKEDKTMKQVLTGYCAALLAMAPQIDKDWEIFGHFDRATIRPMEYVCNGRYRMSILCAKNRKGIAAKAALLAQFFDPDGSRKDIDPDAEKRLILERIAADKAAAQKKEEHLERKQYKNEYGTVFAVREKDGVPRLMHRTPQDTDWRISMTLAAYVGDAKTADELQAVLEKVAAQKGWTLCHTTACDGCQCTNCDDTTCPQSHCEGADHGLGCMAPDEDCPQQTTAQLDEVYKSPKGTLYKIAEKLIGKKRYYHTVTFDPRSCEWVDANSSIYDNMKSAQGEFEAWIRTEKLVPAAPTGAAAATTGEPAVNSERLSEITTTSDASALPVPALPAENGMAKSASSATPTVNPATPAFDYTGLDGATVDALHWAEKNIRESWKKYIIGLAESVAIAHEALCGEGVVQNLDNSKYGHRGEDTFRAWCTYIGISKSKAYSLLHVYDLISGATPEERANLEQAGYSLIYDIAKPSAPAELVQGVKDGDITTHKQYQELLAEIKQRDTKIADLIDASEQADKRTERAESRTKTAEANLRMANNEVKASDERAERAEKRAAEAEKSRDGARQVAEAAKLRADKLKADNDALRAQLQAVPTTVEAQVIDTDEVERLADARAKELLAQWQAEHSGDSEDEAHNAYDAVILACRTLDSVWASLRPNLPKIAPEDKSCAINMWLQKLMSVKEEAIKCL